MDLLVQRKERAELETGERERERRNGLRCVRLVSEDAGDCEEEETGADTVDEEIEDEEEEEQEDEFLGD